jgi:uncharacterized protein with FMN-binding domain
VRTRAVVLSVTASAAVLLVGWEIGNVVAQAQTASSNSGAGSGGASGSPSPGSTGGGSTGSGGTLKDGKFAGGSADTPFGPVQVEIVVSGGKITDVKALQLTTFGGRSVQISNFAAPILRSEVLKAQSANVSNVSGATYTTEGYLTSAQSALDKAKA